MSKIKLYEDSLPFIDINEYAKVSKIMHISVNDILQQFTGRTFNLTSTSLYYGYRTWFLCPSCNDRRRKLYESADGFACRKCLNIKYRSQDLHRNKYYETVIRPVKKLKRIEDKMSKSIKRINREKLQEEYKSILSGINVN